VPDAPNDSLAEERELCERAKSGDREALAELLRGAGPRLYRSVLLPRLGNTASAEEALSQTYLQVIQKIETFSWQSVGFYPWFRRVGLNVAIDQLRRGKRERLFEPADLERELDGQSLQTQDFDALVEHDLAQARSRVLALLDSLNPRYALAIRLRILEEQPRESAARSLEVSVATFDVVLHRAMAALKKAMKSQGDAA
jgi:RNA polymerase sigma-70 factor (ECF subfamily)